MPGNQYKKTGQGRNLRRHPTIDKSLDEENSASISTSQPATEELSEEENMANLDVILQELREFRKENGDTLKDIKEDINNTNNRIDEAEMRIAEAEERVQGVEGAILEMLKRQTRLEARLTDQEGRARRDNIRIHGVSEGAEENSSSVMFFVEMLLKENLDLPPSTDLRIERAHRALGPRPPHDAPPRSIVVKFASHRTKEDIVKAAWQKRGFVYKEKRVNIDHNYALEVLKKT